MSSDQNDNPATMKAINKLFNTLSPDDNHSFLATHPSSSASSPVAVDIEHLAAAQANSENNDDSQLQAPASIAKASAVRRRQILNERKRKKPLNAFIAYRSYYSPMLQNLPQKIKSGIIQKMWAEEDRKPLFALLGQAFSEMRDSNPIASADKDFLKKFLPVAVSLLPIIPAENYLAAMGWVRCTNQDGGAVLERSKTMSSLSNISMSTNYSVRDIINHCYTTGISQRPSSAAASTGRNAGGAMAFAAVPSSVSHQLWPSVETPLLGTQPIASASAAEQMPAEYNFDFSDLSTDYMPSIRQVTADQQHAFDRLPMPMHFHPGIQPPVLGFDPNMIQDSFDPYSFDVDQYLNFEFKI